MVEPLLACPAIPEAAIIIPHLDDISRLMCCLDALVTGSKPDDLRGIEVIVVDNGSTCTLATIRAAFPQVRLISEARRGAAHARNRGAAASSAPYLWFLDADCRPMPGWIRAAWQSRDLADIVAGDVTLFDETPPQRSGAQAFETVFAFDVARYARKGFGVTANLLTTREMFDRTGPFRADRPEDKDWCLRARALGGTLCHAPTLRVAHPTRRCWRDLHQKWRRLTDEAWHESRNRPLARLRWMARAVLVAASVGPHAARVITSDHLNGPTERSRALATLSRIRLTRAGWMIRQALGPSAPRPKSILAVASGGGHWQQLMQIRESFGDHPAYYLTTQPGLRAETGTAATLIPDCNRAGLRNLPRTVILLSWHMIRRRPSVVISTGALPGVIALIVARMIGARTIWIDSVANAERMSMSGRLARHVSHLCLAQWEHVAREAGADFAGSVL